MTTTTIDKLSGYIWLNGELVNWSDAKIHVLSHSLHYAGAVFEGEKAYSGKIFKLEEHTERLIKSAKDLYLTTPYSFDDIIKAHAEVLAKNNIGDAYVRPLIWRGGESLNLINKMLSVNLMIAAIPSTIRPEAGLKLSLSGWRKPHPNSMPPQCKSSGHYNMMIAVQQDAKNNGYDDALLLDYDGYIAECTTTNIFFVKGDSLYTPIADRFLNGITRQTVIMLARDLGLEVKEQRLELSSLADYSECFITGTAAEIKGVESININGDKVNFTGDRITKSLKEEYRKTVLGG